MALASPVFGRCAMRIIIVDPEPTQLESFSRGLSLHGHDCLGYSEPDGAARALGGAAVEPVDLVLIDLSKLWPELLSFVVEVLSDHPEVPLVAIGGLTPTPELERLRDLGVPVMHKPFGPDELDQRLRAAVARHPMRRAS